MKLETLLLSLRFVRVQDETVYLSANKIYECYCDEEIAFNTLLGRIVRIAPYKNPIVVVDAKRVEEQEEKEKERNNMLATIKDNSILKIEDIKEWDDEAKSLQNKVLTVKSDFIKKYYLNNQEDKPPETNTEILDCVNELNNSFSILTNVTQETTESIIKFKSSVEDNLKMEEKNMFDGLNLKFGVYNDPRVGMSMYGLAVKTDDNKYLAYKDGTSTDVTNLLMTDFNNGIFAVPVGLKKIKKNDTILHNNTPMFVTDIHENGDLAAFDLTCSEKKIIVPIKSPFGFNFYTKLICLFDGMDKSADSDNPFGMDIGMMMLMMNNGDSKMDMNSMLPFMLMSRDDDDDHLDNKMLMFMMMSGNGDKINNILPLLLLNGKLNL